MKMGAPAVTPWGRLPRRTGPRAGPSWSFRMRFSRGLNGLCVLAPTAALLLLAGCGGGGGGGGSPPPSPPPGPPAPAAQTIAFSNPGPVAVTYGDGSFTNAAAGGAGTGAISYSSGTPGVAT